MCCHSEEPGQAGEHGFTGVCLSKSHEDDLGIRVFPIQGEAERARPVQLVEEKTFVMNEYEFSMRGGGSKKMEPDSFQQFLVKRNRAMATNGNAGNSI